MNEKCVKCDWVVCDKVWIILIHWEQWGGIKQWEVTYRNVP